MTAPAGIAKVVDQQFEIANKIIAAGLIPIIEPEVDIHNVDKAECETILKKAIASVRDEYDFIIIDCPPSLGLLTF